MLTACVGIRPDAADAQRIYTLTVPLESASQVQPIPLTLLVSLPRAAPGYDTAAMAYTRHAYEIEYFSKNQWAEPPAKMIWPLLVGALEIKAGYRSVAPASGMVKGDIRLDVEISQLQQEFGSNPGRMHIKLRAQLVNLRDFQILATQTFETYENTPTETPYGGVVATNLALKRLLEQIADFAQRQGKAYVSAQHKP